MSIIIESENIATMTVNHYERILRERDEARERNAKLISIAERAIDDLRWFYEGKSDSLVNELDKLKEVAK